MRHYGDITKINGAEIEPVWCITGGSPCQDLSIAGKRAGFKGENGELTRSGLFMEMIRVIREMREKEILNGRTNEHIRPRFVIWENVGGCTTSNAGQDFRTVLEEFCRIKESNISIPMPDGGRWAHSGAIIGNGFSIAWRLMDAQYFGVPQRRKRIALVVDYGGANATDILLSGEPFVGDITDGRFGKVLPIGKGLRGNTTQSRQEGEGVTRSAENGIGESDNSYTLKIRGGSETYLKADGSIGTAGKGALIQTEQSATLGVSQDQTLFTPTTAYDFEPGITRRGNVESRVVEEKTPTLRAKMGDNQVATAYGLGRDSFNSGTNAQFTMSIEEETQPPITERGAGGVCSIAP